MRERRRVGRGLAVVLVVAALGWGTGAAGQPVTPEARGVARAPALVPAEAHAVSGALRDTPAIGPP